MEFHSEVQDARKAILVQHEPTERVSYGITYEMVRVSTLGVGASVARAILEDVWFSVYREDNRTLI
jgi:hypothetical protein